ncbi:unnamed protein product [Durusdinium trenchii]|uniref:Uncharacterized protein n=1 Tax=Durusdinium trenchii TaxID=1381693 RepID=A0ABP0R157_9DINO
MSINRNASSASMETDEEEEPLHFLEFKERVLSEEMVKTKLFDACRSQLGKGTTMKNIGRREHRTDVGVKVALMVIILLLILSFLLPSTHDLSFQLVCLGWSWVARHFYSNETSPDVPQDLLEHYLIWQGGLSRNNLRPRMLYLDLNKRVLCDEMQGAGQAM